MHIRLATPQDGEALSAIYRHYVENTAVSFEYDAPTPEEFRGRIQKTLAEYPYLVAEEDGIPVGYAYAGPFRTRRAYKHWAEASIYIKKDYHGHGIGRALYTQLEKILVKQNIYTVSACITFTDREDEHLTDASIRFHTCMGYHISGKHVDCGYKFDKWYSVVMMEKPIREKDPHPEAFIPFPAL